MKKILIYFGVGMLFAYGLEILPSYGWRLFPSVVWLPHEYGILLFVFVHIPLLAVLIALIAGTE